MSTKPKHDTSSIIQDAEHVLAAAKEDEAQKEFRARITKHDLDLFEANLDALKSALGGRSHAALMRVKAGVHAAEARAALVDRLHDVRDDAKLAFPDDVELQHAFGAGAMLRGDSTREVEDLAHAILAAAHANPEAAKKLHLDGHGIHVLEDLLHALEGAELAHVRAASNRHEASTTADSLAHLVAATAAHVRLAARRVFRHDEAKLARYAPTLPRHEVKPRAPVAKPPPAAATQA